MCNKCNSKVIPEDDPVICAGEKLGNITCMEDSIATALMQILVTNFERIEKSDIQVVHDLVEPLHNVSLNNKLQFFLKNYKFQVEII